MPDPLNLFVMIVFGAVGTAYFIYGKKQQRVVPLIVGIALMGYSFFVSSLTWNIIIGVILSIIPFFIQI